MTAGVHWKRKLRISVAGKEMNLDDFQCEFQVRQTDVQHPDWAYVRITNLSPGTSSGIFHKGVPVQINAGYHQGPFGEIFKGDSDQQRRGKANGTDTYHDILATSGGKAYATATVHETLPAGSTNRDILMKALKPFQEQGVQIGHLPTSGLDKKHDRAVTLNGMSKDIIRYVGETIDASWTVFNNTFQMVETGKTLPDVVEISSETGLIGIPEQQLNGIVVKILINPQVKIGQKVHIDKEIIKSYLAIQGQYGNIDVKAEAGPTINEATGIYKVVRIDHDGSVHGQEWYTTLTCLQEGMGGGLAAGAKGNQAQTGRSVTEEQDRGGFESNK